MRTTPVTENVTTDRPMCSLPQCPEYMGTDNAQAWITATFGTQQVMSTVGGLQEWFCSWSHLSDWAQLPVEAKLAAVKANGAPGTDLQAWARVPAAARPTKI